MSWYKDNIYSAKLADLLYEKIENEQNPVIRYILVSLVIYEQPDHWSDVVRKYLAKTDKNSFYFGDTLSSLRVMYAKGAMSEANVARTKDLIFLAYTKLASKDGRMNPGLMKNINTSVLPERSRQEEN